MARNVLSAKRIQIDKANATVMVFVAVTAFVAAFAIVSSRALISQMNYNNRVIAKKELAKKQLRDNNAEAEKLVSTYKSWVAEPTNIISGSSTGTGERDGDNAVIILDALPSKYDFPALVTSVEKLLTNPSYIIDTITGVDDELNQSKSDTATEIKPVDMPFTISVNSNFDGTQQLLELFHRSIRPISVVKLGISGGDNNLTVKIDANTYYQPQKTVNITKEVVR